MKRVHSWIRHYNPAKAAACCLACILGRQSSSATGIHLEEAMNTALWDHLGDRYADGQRPHTMLALDGGGIRGLITLGILEEIERLLRQQLGRGDDFRLCQYFDYIAGTSTGAIIAAGLARGLSVRELLDFY